MTSLYEALRIYHTYRFCQHGRIRSLFAASPLLSVIVLAIAFVAVAVYIAQPGTDTSADPIQAITK